MNFFLPNLAQKRALLKLLCCMLFFYLSGCGFHLRGTMPLAPPLRDLYLQTADPYGQLANSLKRYLKMSGVHLAATPADATTILVILSETTGQQLLGISGTQQTRQYNLILVVTFQVTGPQGQVIVGPQVITETRALTITADQILAGSNEANSLYFQMREAIVYEIMSRLASQDIAALFATNKIDKSTPVAVSHDKMAPT